MKIELTPDELQAITHQKRFEELNRLIGQANEEALSASTRAEREEDRRIQAESDLRALQTKLNVAVNDAGDRISFDRAYLTDQIKRLMNIIPSQKIAAIKLIREMTGMGLKESKELAELCPFFNLTDKERKMSVEDFIALHFRF